MKSGSTWQNRHRRTTWPRTRGRTGPPPKVLSLSNCCRNGRPSSAQARGRGARGPGAALAGVPGQQARRPGGVDGVKVWEPPPPPKVFGNDAGGWDAIDSPGDGQRVVARVVPRPDGVGQP